MRPQDLADPVTVAHVRRRLSVILHLPRIVPFKQELVEVREPSGDLPIGILSIWRAARYMASCSPDHSCPKNCSLSRGRIAAFSHFQIGNTVNPKHPMINSNVQPDTLVTIDGYTADPAA